MDQVLSIEVTTDGAGLVRIELRDGAGNHVSAIERTFTEDNAEQQAGWIATTLGTATFAAVAAGVL